MSPAQRFQQLVLPHLDAGFNLARWLLHDAHDASDATQDACLRALASIDGLRGAAARPWFLTIVRHACYDWLRRNPRPPDVDPGEAADPAGDALEQAARAADARALAAAVSALPLVYREAIVLRELEGLSYLEIAQVAGVPVGTVMSRLSRARRLLRRSPLLEAVMPAQRRAEPT